LRPECAIYERRRDRGIASQVACRDDLAGGLCPRVVSELRIACRIRPRGLRFGGYSQLSVVPCLVNWFTPRGRRW
jgi:hypothetical protein